ncbi:DUF4192 family protein [Microbacterium sp. 2FI]|uniref:DUF4192 family protein n=1 Tax=Microbacterium sp. 2FI TaxID=2502193 RepID=UPI0010F56BF8|nr:DUF4192 family protein [Microbacterium sp. 2FI]
MTTIVKAANAAAFLTLVPRMLGFHPTQSLVLIPFARSRSLGAMRVDLPDDEPDALDRVASTVIGMACRIADADAVAFVVYTDARFDAGGGVPHADLMSALERRADACGLHVTDALCVAADAWRRYLDADGPALGHPLSELDAIDARDALENLPPETEPAGDQASGAELPEVDLAEKERVGRAIAALREAVGLVCGSQADEPAHPNADEPRIDPLALAAMCTLDDLPTLFEAALAWRPDALEPYQTAALGWCLSRPALRDIALVQWVGGMDAGDEAFDAQLRWEAGEEYPAHLAMHMWGEGEQPDPARLHTALELVRHVAAAVPREGRPGPLATCAWMAWALGRSTHADVYARQACEIEPEHGLAEIVRSFVHVGHLPEWAFQRGGTAT